MSKTDESAPARCPMCNEIRLRRLMLPVTSVPTIAHPEIRHFSLEKMECASCGVMMNPKEFGMYGIAYARLEKEQKEKAAAPEPQA